MLFYLHIYIYFILFDLLIILNFPIDFFILFLNIYSNLRGKIKYIKRMKFLIRIFDEEIEIISRI